MELSLNNRTGAANFSVSKLIGSFLKRLLYLAVNTVTVDDFGFCGSLKKSLKSPEKVTRFVTDSLTCLWSLSCRIEPSFSCQTHGLTFDPRILWEVHFKLGDYKVRRSRGYKTSALFLRTEQLVWGVKAHNAVFVFSKCGAVHYGQTSPLWTSFQTSCSLLRGHCKPEQQREPSICRINHKYFGNLSQTWLKFKKNYIIYYGNSKLNLCF